MAKYKRAPRLSYRDLDAIYEALKARLAGEIKVADSREPQRQDYERALERVTERILSRPLKAAVAMMREPADGQR